MTPERWQIIEKIFHRARELDPEKRANYLAEAFEQDDELRQQVPSGSQAGERDADPRRH